VSGEIVGFAGVERLFDVAVVLNPADMFWLTIGNFARGGHSGDQLTKLVVAGK